MSGGANQQQAMTRTSDIIGQINATKNQSNSVKDLTESIMRLKTAQLSLKEIQIRKLVNDKFSPYIFIRLSFNAPLFTLALLSLIPSL